MFNTNHKIIQPLRIHQHYLSHGVQMSVLITTLFFIGSNVHAIFFVFRLFSFFLKYSLFYFLLMLFQRMTHKRSQDLA